METRLVIIGGGIALISSLITLLLQAYISRKNAHGQTLTKIRLSVYSKLISASIEEESYPGDFMPTLTKSVQEEVEEYNAKVKDWRADRRRLKGIASEALLLTSNIDLRNKLSSFISNNNPDVRLVNVEKLMKEELGVTK